MSDTNKEKTFVGKILSWIGGIFHHAESELQAVILPFISHLLDAIKGIVESPITGEIVSFIPGNLPKEIFDKVKAILPKVANEFGLVVELEYVTTPDELNAVLQKIFASVKWPTDIDKQKFLSSFGARVLQEIKDNSMSFATAIIDIEFFFKNYHGAVAAPLTDDTQSPAEQTQQQAPQSQPDIKNILGQS